MDTYTITEIRTNEDSITTMVTFNFSGTEVVTAITHFRPTDLAAITAAIENRATSEKSRLAAISVCQGLEAQIQSLLNQETQI